MAEQGNVQRVKDFYAALGRGDIATLLQGMADDIEMVIPGAPGNPAAGKFKGKQAVQGCFGTLGQTASFTRFEPYDFIAQGDKVVALIHAEATTIPANKHVVDEIAQVLTFRDGKLAHLVSFNDTAAVAEGHRTN